MALAAHRWAPSWCAWLRQNQGFVAMCERTDVLLGSARHAAPKLCVIFLRPRKAWSNRNKSGLTTVLTPKSSGRSFQASHTHHFESCSLFFFKHIYIYIHIRMYIFQYIVRIYMYIIEYVYIYIFQYIVYIYIFQYIVYIYSIIYIYSIYIYSNI